MKEVNDYPPNYKEITTVFDLRGKRPVFTYGDTIYSPHGDYLPDHLKVHEQVHMRQQGNHPDAWWSRYLKDAPFRLTQELEAYQAQYTHLTLHYTRPWRRKILRQISADLAGPMYGNMITEEDAKVLITGKSELVRKEAVNA